MREIKFRAWHIAENEYHWEVGIDGCFCIVYDWSRVCRDYNGGNPVQYGQKAISPPEAGRIGLGLVDLEQYTGLKDKNGTEIYEGDIVVEQDAVDRGDGDTDPVVYAVSWDDETCGFVFIENTSCTNGIFQSIDIDFSKAEVMGNIYENPELVEDV